MDLKRLVTHFTYRIEQKPGGGFIAHPSDATLPPLEAPTRIELQQKIRDNISAALVKEFPGLKLPENNRISFHLEKQGDGSFAFHSADPNHPGSSATHAEFESRFAEKMFSLFGKQIISHLPADVASQLPPDLANQLGSGNIKVFVERKVVTLQNSGAGTAEQAPSGTQTGPITTDSNYSINAADNSPITPERSSTGNIFRFLLAALIVLAAVYMYFHFRH
jgi:hypothetical protein